MLHYVTRLYLGRAVPEGARVNGIVAGTGVTVSEATFDRFVGDVISRKFPDGYTLINAEGGWLDARTGRTIREPSTILEVYHDGSMSSRVAIRSVALDYKTSFGQDAVMVSTVNLTEGVDFI